MASLNRRGFVTGLLGFIAAPAIVRAASLMPVSLATVQAWLSPEEIVRRLLASLSDGAHFRPHALPGDPAYQRGAYVVRQPSLSSDGNGNQTLTLHGASREGCIFEMPARA